MHTTVLQKLFAGLSLHITIYFPFHPSFPSIHNRLYCFAFGEAIAHHDLIRIQVLVTRISHRVFTISGYQLFKLFVFVHNPDQNRCVVLLFNVNIESEDSNTFYEGSQYELSILLVVPFADLAPFYNKFIPISWLIINRVAVDLTEFRIEERNYFWITFVPILFLQFLLRTHCLFLSLFYLTRD